MVAIHPELRILSHRLVEMQNRRRKKSNSLPTEFQGPYYFSGFRLKTMILVSSLVSHQSNTGTPQIPMPTKSVKLQHPPRPRRYPGAHYALRSSPNTLRTCFHRGQTGQLTSEISHEAPPVLHRLGVTNSSRYSCTAAGESLPFHVKIRGFTPSCTFETCHYSLVVVPL